MWTTELLKRNAKNALRGRYGRSVLVCLVVSLLTGSLSVPAGRGYDALQEQATPSFGHLPSAASSYGNNAVWPLLLILLPLLLLAALAFSIFVAGPLQVGLKRYFMESRSGLTPWGTLWSVFRTPYLNVVKVQFLVGLKILLGSLLLIPGIYWSYCYRQVPFLLAENPYLTTGRAMELSRQMMDGEKFHTFLLELSFLGWTLLCMFTAGIGFLFLEPYLHATFAELYAAMRAKALANGLSSTHELGGFVQRG